MFIWRESNNVVVTDAPFSIASRLPNPTRGEEMMVLMSDENPHITSVHTTKSRRHGLMAEALQDCKNPDDEPMYIRLHISYWTSLALLDRDSQPFFNKQNLTAALTARRLALAPMENFYDKFSVI